MSIEANPQSRVQYMHTCFNLTESVIVTENVEMYCKGSYQRLL